MYLQPLDKPVLRLRVDNRINQIAVYRNGARLAQSRDFTANDGSTVTLVSAATADDVIAYQIFDDFSVADAIVSSASAQTIDGDLTVTGTISGLNFCNWCCCWYSVCWYSNWYCSDY